MHEGSLLWFAECGAKVSHAGNIGSGDTFMGYFLGARLEGRDIPACVDLAARAAAICVSRLGASVAIPNRDEVEAFDRC